MPEILKIFIVFYPLSYPHVYTISYCTGDGVGIQCGYRSIIKNQLIIKMTDQNKVEKKEYDITKIALRNEKDLKLVLAANYQKQIENYFGDEKKALRFLSGVIADVQRIPKLIQCSPVSLINSYIQMAELGLMPSGVSGEAYVLPYDSKQGMQAQFQLGYQGLVTLFYRAGARSITAEIVRKEDDFTYVNGQLKHVADPFKKDRGEAIGAYVIVELQAGGKVTKVMSKEEILEIGQKFSKSFNSKFTPWNVENDPQLWMWKKTVLKQAAKMVPKNETIFKAIALDNKDSILEDRLEAAEKEAESLKMGNLITDNAKSKNTKENQAPADDAGGSEAQGDGK